MKQRGQAVLLIELAIILVLLGGGAIWARTYWNSTVAEPYRVEGDARTMTKLNAPDGEITLLKTQVTDLTRERDEARTDLATEVKNNEELTSGLAAAKASIAQLRKIAAAAQARSRKLLAEIAARPGENEMIARLVAIAHGPPVPFAEACARANEYLTDLARWRRSL